MDTVIFVFNYMFLLIMLPQKEYYNVHIYFLYPSFVAFSKHFLSSELVSYSSNFSVGA